MAESAVDELKRELRALKDASGLSLDDLAGLRDRAGARGPFTTTSLSDWFSEKKKTVPLRFNRLRALVDVLEKAALRRNPGRQRKDGGDPSYWEELWRRARAERQPRQEVRAAASAPGPTGASVPGQPVLAMDAAKARRVLTALPDQTGWLYTLRTKPMDRVHYEDVALKFDAACEQLRRETTEFEDPDLQQAYAVLVDTALALDCEMDGMHGPDHGSPWRVLKNYQPQRAEQLGKLTAARDAFDAAYRAIVQRFGVRNLLPQEVPAPAAAPDEAQRVRRAGRDLRQQFRQSEEAAAVLECLEDPGSGRRHGDVGWPQGGIDAALEQREGARAGVRAMNQVLQQRIDAVELLVPAAARRHLDALRTHADALEEIASYRHPLPDEGVRLGTLGRHVTTDRVLAGFDAALLGYREALAPS